MRSISARACVFSSLTRDSMDVAAVEDVRVLEQVGLMGEDLLQAQRPLLVPIVGAARAPRSTPGSCIARQRALRLSVNTQGLDQDPPCVVFGLCFGEAQGVDLDPVAKASIARVFDAVAFARDLVPQLGERPHLAGFFDEANAGVDEEADTADGALELLVREVSAASDFVEDADGGGQREGQLLDRRRAGFLQMVRAHVRGVPVWNALQAVFVHLGDDAKVCFRWKDVGAAREVLFDDVVLGGPAQ